MSKNKVDFSKGIYDARQLGTPRMLLLGFQHMFAMFGATVLVPLITGLDIATTLLMAGLGTLLFHVFTKFKVPAFLGSSFAFLGGYATVAPKLPDANGELTIANTEMLPYACVGVACAGLLYLVLATIIKNNWWLALIALGIVIVVNVFGKGMAKIIPILIGILGAYAVAGIVGNGFGVESFAIDFSSVKEAAWVGLPIHWSSTVFGGVHDTGKAVTAIIAIMPIALATMMEHIGDISAIGATCGKNYIADPGLHRSLAGDGLATTMSALFGGPANTTYGENTGVLALSKVYDPRVIRIAAYFAILFSFSPKFAALIDSMPAAIVGGISFVLYGMISAIGIRNVVENKVDFSKPRNTIIAAVILVCALGLGDGVSFHIGQFDINLSALAVAALAGIILNAIFPGKDYDFSKQSAADVKSTKDNKAEAKAE